jgi:hypothetical protein
MAVIHGKALLNVNRKNLLNQRGSWHFGMKVNARMTKR